MKQSEYTITYVMLWLNEEVLNRCKPDFNTSNNFDFESWYGFDDHMV